MKIFNPLFRDFGWGFLFMGIPFGVMYVRTEWDWLLFICGFTIGMGINILLLYFRLRY